LSEQIEIKVSGRVLLRGEIRGGSLVAELALRPRSWANEVGLSSCKEGSRSVYDIPAALVPDLIESVRVLGPELAQDLTTRLAPLLVLAADQAENSKRVRGSLVDRMMPVPVEDDLLMPFQREGVGWLLATGGVGLIGDDMGLGKTAQGLGWMRHAGIRRAIVVCPASVVLNWCREAARFYPDAKPSPILSSKDMERFQASEGPWIVVVTWDGLRRMWRELLALSPEAVVADEAHYAKSPEAMRTRALLWVGSALKHRVLLSGTPMKNRPRELFPLLHLLDPVQFRAFLPYGERYCGPKTQRFGHRHVRTYDGSTHAEELNLRLRPYMIRRVKSEVLSQLPPKSVQRLPLPVDTWLESLREAGEPAVLFCHHRSVVQALSEACRGRGWRYVTIAGDTPITARQDAVAAFQAGEADVLLATEAAKEGITLTRSAYLAFVEYFWVPGDMAQASDRVWRISQQREVFVTILHLEGSLDDHVAKVIDRKTKVIDTVQDNRSVEAEVIRELLEAP